MINYLRNKSFIASSERKNSKYYDYLSKMCLFSEKDNKDGTFTFTIAVIYPHVINALGESNSKCSMLDEYKEGDNVTLHFNLRGRAAAHREDKYFNSLEIWRITKNK